jgi:V8-like Glu-specific endopeptidase
MKYQADVATTALILALVSVACGGTSNDDQIASFDGSPAITPASDAKANPSPAIIEVKGRAFKRSDLWTPEELERIAYEGDGRRPSTDPAVYAAQLRTHMLGPKGYYIELEPNLELAKRILAGQGEQGTAAGLPRVERNVIQNDDRVHTSSAFTYPSTTLGFSEVGCTLSKIGTRTAITAAHCLWYPGPPRVGWMCDDATVGTPFCPQNHYPRYRFGVEGTSSFSGPTDYACQNESIPQGFRGIGTPTDVTSEWNYARWDYAGIDLTNCATGNTGYLGTWIASDAQLSTFGYIWGYPARATCPYGALGNPGKPGPGGAITETDCPGTGTWPGSTWLISGSGPYGKDAPYTGAQLWGMNQTGAGPGDMNVADTIWMPQDETPGDSGAPLYFFYAPGDRRVMGHVSWGGSDANKGHRFTSETYNWIAANSSFPNDR